MASSSTNDFTSAVLDGGPGAGPRHAWPEPQQRLQPLRRLSACAIRPEQTGPGLDHCPAWGEATSRLLEGTALLRAPRPATMQARARQAMPGLAER